MSYAEDHAPKELISRGDKGPSPLGTALFLGLRGADPFLQYAILRHGWGTRLIQLLGSDVLPLPSPSATGSTLLDGLALSPYRLILLSMAVGSALKQNVWLVALSYERMQPSAAVTVSAFNTVVNSINTLLFICRATSAASAAAGRRDEAALLTQTPLLVGAGLYVLGMLLESGSEVQRTRFKQTVGNKGLLYRGGLFAWARHINYTGYLLWRTGFALASGGWAWGVATAAFFTYNFSTNAIPPLTQYCKERYREQWTRYERDTPYKLFPGIY